MRVEDRKGIEKAKTSIFGPEGIRSEAQQRPSGFDAALAAKDGVDRLNS